MSATGSAFNYGLFYEEKIVAAGSFSKGRKMDRLAGDQRSFELIRFCNGKGITVSGGLSKLVKHFIREKNPGDIMTYVDKQFAEGGSFLKMGFRKLGETKPVCFLVDKNLMTRKPMLADSPYDKKKYYKSCNEGNLKFVLVVDSADS